MLNLISWETMQYTNTTMIYLTSWENNALSKKCLLLFKSSTFSICVLRRDVYFSVSKYKSNAMRGTYYWSRGGITSLDN